MKSIPNLKDFIDYKTQKKLDASWRRAAAVHEHENTLMAESPVTVFQRLLKVYKNLKPLLVFLTTFPLVPQSVRNGIGVLVQTLQSVTDVGSELTAQFKAGKDLGEVA